MIINFEAVNVRPEGDQKVDFKIVVAYCNDKNKSGLDPNYIWTMAGIKMMEAFGHNQVSCWRMK